MPGKYGYALCGVVVLALLLRLQGITYGLPLDFYVRDEPQKANTIAQFRQGTFQYRPKQPSFLVNTSYLFQFATRPFKDAFLARIEIPRAASPAMLETAFLIWSGRLWMVLIGSATCLLLFFVGRRLWDSAAGLFAASFYALWPLPIAAAHYVKEDTPLAFFTTLTLFFCLRLIEHGRWRDYLLVGLSCGLAFGAKYPGAFTFAALLGAHFLRTPESKATFAGKGFAGSQLAPLSGALAASLLGFVLTSPQHLLQIKSLVGSLFWQSEYLVRGHGDSIRVEALPEWFSFYLRKALWPGLAGAGLLVAIGGWIAAIVVTKDQTRLRMLTLVAGWMAAYYLLAESMPSKPYPFFARYILPTVPLLALGAGIGCSLLWHLIKTADGIHRHLARAGLILILALTLLPAALFAWQVVPDTRDLAMSWLDRRSGTLIPQRYSRYPIELRPQAAGHWTVLPFQDCLPDIDTLLNTADGPVYVAFNSFNTDRWLAHPDAKPKCTARIQRVMKEGRLELDLRKPFAKFGFHNPDILIYRMK